MVSRASQPCEKPRFHSIYSWRASTESRHSQKWSRYPSPCRWSEVELHGPIHHLNGSWEPFIPGPPCLMSVDVQGTWQWWRYHNCFQKPTPALNYLCRRRNYVNLCCRLHKKTKDLFSPPTRDRTFCSSLCIRIFGGLEVLAYPISFFRKKNSYSPSCFYFSFFFIE